MDIIQPTIVSSAPYKRSNHRSKTATRKKRSLEDYEFVSSENSKLKTSDLGAGAYGNVKRVREKATGEIFAMKIMSKQNIFRYSNKENLRREIHIQRSILHPHIISLKHYFEDLQNVYIVMEYAENGTLFDHIRRKKKCSENESFIYFFQTSLAIDYLHKRNVIHRDLKPENLLLDKSGNIKVCDFGWSAEAENIKRHTFCGTIDYMAPEMIKNLPHDYRIDIWSLGVLLYELLHGRAPFQGKNDQEKCKNIAKNAGITFDSSLSPEACDLITKILKPDPRERLEMIELFNHPWMKKFEAIYKIDIMSYVIQQDSTTGEVSLLNDSAIDSPHGSVGEIDGNRKKSRERQREPSLEIHAKSQFANYDIKTSLGQISTKESDVNSRPGSGVDPTSSSSSRVFPFEVEPSKKFMEDSYRVVYHGHKTDQERSRSKFLQTIQTDKDQKRFKSTGRESISSLFRKDSEGEARGKRNYVYYHNQSFDNDEKSLVYLYKRNQEIEKRFQNFQNNRKEPGFFEKILMGIGCISRDSKAHVDI